MKRKFWIVDFSEDEFLTIPNVKDNIKWSYPFSENETAFQPINIDEFRRLTIEYLELIDDIKEKGNE